MIPCGAGLEKAVFGKCMRCRIVMSVVENVADICQDCQRSQCYLHNAAQDYAKTMTDVMLEQQIQTGHPHEYL